MALRPCLDCGTLTRQSRCPTHQRATAAAKRATRPRLPGETARRAATVAQWRATYGDWCPGWQRPGHHASDLTADHVQAVAAGGLETGALSVLCRACNGTKGAR